MNTALLATYVKLATLKTLISDRVALEHEEGQTAAEYIGVIVVLAAVIAIVAGFAPEIGQVIRSGIENAIGRMTGG